MNYEGDKLKTAYRFGDTVSFIYKYIQSFFIMLNHTILEDVNWCNKILDEILFCNQIIITMTKGKSGGKTPEIAEHIQIKKLTTNEVKV